MGNWEYILTYYYVKNRVNSFWCKLIGDNIVTNFQIILYNFCLLKSTNDNVLFPWANYVKNIFDDCGLCNDVHEILIPSGRNAQ